MSIIELLDKKLDGVQLGILFFVLSFVAACTAGAAFKYTAVVFRGWPPPEQVCCDCEEDDDAS